MPAPERSAHVWVADWAPRVLIEAHREPQLNVVVADVALLAAGAVSHVDEDVPEEPVSSEALVSSEELVSGWGEGDEEEEEGEEVQS